MITCHFFIVIFEFFFSCYGEYQDYECECSFEDDYSFCNCSFKRIVEDIVDFYCNFKICCYCFYLCFACCFKKSNNYHYSGNNSIPRISKFANNKDDFDQEIKNIKKTFEDNFKVSMESINKDEKKVKEELDMHLKDRESKLKPKAKKLNEEVEKIKKKNNEILSKMLKDLNKKELEIEKDMLVNEVNKMHIIYELGIKLVEPCKKAFIDNLKDKMSKLPPYLREPLESKITEIINLNAEKFLNSKFGEPLIIYIIKKCINKKRVKRNIFGKL